MSIERRFPIRAGRLDGEPASPLEWWLEMVERNSVSWIDEDEFLSAFAHFGEAARPGLLESAFNGSHLALQALGALEDRSILDLVGDGLGGKGTLQALIEAGANLDDWLPLVLRLLGSKRSDRRRAGLEQASLAHDLLQLEKRCKEGDELRAAVEAAARSELYDSEDEGFEGVARAIECFDILEDQRVEAILERIEQTTIFWLTNWLIEILARLSEDGRRALRALHDNADGTIRNMIEEAIQKASVQKQPESPLELSPQDLLLIDCGLNSDNHRKLEIHLRLRNRIHQIGVAQLDMGFIVLAEKKLLKYLSRQTAGPEIVSLVAQLSVTAQKAVDVNWLRGEDSAISIRDQLTLDALLSGSNVEVDALRSLIDEVEYRNEPDVAEYALEAIVQGRLELDLDIIKLFQHSGFGSALDTFLDYDGYWNDFIGDAVISIAAEEQSCRLLEVAEDSGHPHRWGALGALAILGAEELRPILIADRMQLRKKSFEFWLKLATLVPTEELFDDVLYRFKRLPAVFPKRLRDREYPIIDWFYAYFRHTRTADRDAVMAASRSLLTGHEALFYPLEVELLRRLAADSKAPVEGQPKLPNLDEEAVLRLYRKRGGAAAHEAIVNMEEVARDLLLTGLIPNAADDLIESLVAAGVEPARDEVASYMKRRVHNLQINRLDPRVDGGGEVDGSVGEPVRIDLDLPSCLSVELADSRRVVLGPGRIAARILIVAELPNKDWSASWSAYLGFTYGGKSWRLRLPSMAQRVFGILGDDFKPESPIHYFNEAPPAWQGAILTRRCCGQVGAFTDGRGAFEMPIQGDPVVVYKKYQSAFYEMAPLAGTDGVDRHFAIRVSGLYAMYEDENLQAKQCIPPAVFTLPILSTLEPWFDNGSAILELFDEDLHLEPGAVEIFDA